MAVVEKTKIHNNHNKNSNDISRWGVGGWDLYTYFAEFSLLLHPPPPHICLSVSLSLSLQFFRVRVLSVCLSVCLSVGLSLSLSLSSVCLFVRPSVRLNVCRPLSLSLSVCLSVSPPSRTPSLSFLPLSWMCRLCLSG